MKFLFTADWHLSVYSQDKIEVVTSLPERLASIMIGMYQMGKYCVENSIDHMIIGGDLLHGKSIIYAKAQNIMLNFFRAYPGLNFIVIDGNHDLSGKGADAESALLSIDSEPNVHLISEKSFRLDRNILLVPYSYDMIDEIKSNSADILISHLGLNEGTLNSGVSIIADIGMKDLREKYNLVFLGHYHKPQEILSDNLNVYYVGSPIQLDWGEKHEEKRFLVVDSKWMTVESVPTKLYKKYIEYELRIDNKDEVMKSARDQMEAGHHVNIKRVEDVDMSDMTDFKVTDRVEKDITNRGVDSSMSMEEKLKKYMEINKIPKTRQANYLKIAKEIIEESHE